MAAVEDGSPLHKGKDMGLLPQEDRIIMDDQACPFHFSPPNLTFTTPVRFS